jgi:hypothetical protein
MMAETAVENPKMPAAGAIKEADTGSKTGLAVIAIAITNKNRPGNFTSGPHYEYLF